MTREMLDRDAIRRHLPAHPWAERVEVLDTVGSTNLYLKRLAADGAAHGSVVLAERQTAGRGRLGRSFLSESGVGVYLSVLLRPNCPPKSLMSLTAQTAVAVRRAIGACCGVLPQIKWVNDLLLNGKKICGILTELSMEADGDRVRYAIVGIGVNCNQNRGDFPAPLAGIASSIFAETGVWVDRNRLAAGIIRAVSELTETDWLAEYRSACVNLGRQIRILSPDGEQTAFALSVDEEGALLVRDPDGNVRRINSGEVSIREI